MDAARDLQTWDVLEVEGVEVWMWKVWMWKVGT